MIKFNGISKSFGAIKALEDVSFEVKKGEFVYITGPSGAGKTTLLRLLLKEFKPDKGEIILDGVDITKLPEELIPSYRQKIGVVFQDYKILNERTVRENIEVALAVIGVPEDAWPGRVAQVLKLVGLTERAELFPNQLSGGEIQRTSLARGLVVNPKVILADEPTGNLDWETADSIMELLDKINKEGKTVIMATHNVVIVEKYKKRTIKIKAGRLASKEKLTEAEKPKEVVSSEPSKEVVKEGKIEEKKKVRAKVEEE
jgi:cell division transport system ATP-binding protein